MILTMNIYVENNCFMWKNTQKVIKKSRLGKNIFKKTYKLKKFTKKK